MRVAATNAATLTLLVHGDGLPPRSVIALYAITNGAPVAPDAAFADLWPVSVSIQRAGANEAPPTWADMRFMATRPDRARKQFLLEGLIPITSADEGPRQWYQGSWKRPIYVAHLSGWMLMPAAGRSIIHHGQRQGLSSPLRHSKSVRHFWYPGKSDQAVATSIG